MNYKTDVCIVGAGPGGALLAHLLVKQNISVMLIEKNGDISKEFRGEHLNEDGRNVLLKHGIYHQIEELGLLFMKQVEYWEAGKLYKTILPHPKEGHVGIHVPQKHLLTVLDEASKAYSCYQLLLNTRVTELVQDEAGNYTGIKAIRNQEEILIESSLIIGADGRFSIIRKKADIPVTMIKHGYDLLWAKIPAPPEWEPSIKMAVANDTQLSVFTQTGGFIQIGWNIEEGSFPQLRKQAFEPFIQHITEAFPELGQALAAHIHSWGDFVLLQVQSSTCGTWVQDGVVLIGDAAHTMSPTGAFGLNCALKDADVLAGIIKEGIDKNNLTMGQLKKFEHTQRAEIEKLQALQLEREKSFKGNFAVYA